MNSKSFKASKHDYSNPKKHEIHKYHFFVEITPEEAFCKNCGVDIKKNSYCIFDSQPTNDPKGFFCVNCKVCPNLHNLGFRYDLSVQNDGIYTENEYGCDCCDRNLKLKGRLLSCPDCEFDLCPECQTIHFQLPHF